MCDDDDIRDVAGSRVNEWMGLKRSNENKIAIIIISHYSFSFDGRPR